VQHSGEAGAAGPVQNCAKAAVLNSAKTAVPVSAATTMQVFLQIKN
jgi:hypothetical protein